jgi:hypothetical protein
LNIGDHQNLIRTRIRRFLRDTCGLSQRTAQNLGDMADYGKDVAMALVPFLGPLEKAKKAGKVIKAAAKKAVGKVTENIEHPLVPGEGEVGIYGRMQSQNRREGLDQVEANHLPPASFLRRHGIKREDGVSINTQQIRGAGSGRHREFHRKPEVRSLTRPEDQTKSRDALSQCIRSMRKVYQRDGSYTPDIRRGLQEVIRQNKEKHSQLFKKK